MSSVRPDIATLDWGQSISVTVTTFMYRPRTCYAHGGTLSGARCQTGDGGFDLGHLRFANQMLSEGLIDAPAMYQVCLGIPWGAGADPGNHEAMVGQLRPTCSGRVSVSAGRKCPWWRRPCCWGQRSGRTGGQPLSGKGVFASNGELVEKAIRIVRELGGRPCVRTKPVPSSVSSDLCPPRSRPVQLAACWSRALEDICPNSGITSLMNSASDFFCAGMLSPKLAQ
ncbi:MAG: hypothetical protein Ct9H300mP16_18960 [Pseudomonadota bacterium]|nr:MAG: hypothetical protein Ct9H300mP16_18960 [Pseudomonadota bacterium]